MADDLRSRALALYTPPFKYEHGYIFDANGEMVADQGGSQPYPNAPLRVRGWGRIGYMQDGAQLQDEVGKVLAELLTSNWPSRRP